MFREIKPAHWADEQKYLFRLFLFTVEEMPSGFKQLLVNRVNDGNQLHTDSFDWTVRT